MKRTIIACRTIEKELHAAMEKCGCRDNVHFLESGLHNVPGQLRAQLQMLLEECEEADIVLLAMGVCGNFLVGMYTGAHRLAVPRCEDCISLLLGSVQRRQSIKATYFLTEGWLRGEKNIWYEYQAAIKKYGKKRAQRIFDHMLMHYRYLALLVDGEVSDRSALQDQVCRIAGELGLSYAELEGSLDYLCELLTGKWKKERFFCFPPHYTIRSEDCNLKGVGDAL